MDTAPTSGSREKRYLPAGADEFGRLFSACSCVGTACDKILIPLKIKKQNKTLEFITLRRGGGAEG